MLFKIHNLCTEKKVGQALSNELVWLINLLKGSRKYIKRLIAIILGYGIMGDFFLIKLLVIFRNFNADFLLLKRWKNKVYYKKWLKSFWERILKK